MNIDMDLDDFDRIQASTPVVASFKPSSEYNISDFHWAGGVPGILNEIKDYLNPQVPLIAGGSLQDALALDFHPLREIIRPITQPLAPDGCFGILKGNLAPLGSVVKKTGVDPSMMKHTGPAVVFDSEEDVRDLPAGKGGSTRVGSGGAL